MSIYIPLVLLLGAAIVCCAPAFVILGYAAADIWRWLTGDTETRTP